MHRGAQGQAEGETTGSGPMSYDRPKDRRIPVAPWSYQTSRRTWRAWREDSASKQAASDDGRPNKHPLPLPPHGMPPFARAITRGLIRPSGLSALIGQGELSFGGACRAAQQPIPQHRPSSVPQQQVVARWSVATRAPPAACKPRGNRPATARLTVRLPTSSHRVGRYLEPIMAIIAVGGPSVPNCSESPVFRKIGRPIGLSRAVQVKVAAESGSDRPSHFS